MFAGNNDLQVYKNFFAWVGKPELFKMRRNRTLEYADLAPLAYLHIALEGNTKYSVKHLLIDEMQDYSSIQYKVIQKLFPCRKTVRVLFESSQEATNSEMRVAYEEFVKHIVTLSDPEDYSHIFRMLNLTRIEIASLKEVYQMRAKKKCA